MRIARVQIADVATPVLTLVLDGAFYDVAKLELAYGLSRAFGGGDFHTRVIAARCAGLSDLEARLATGARPAEARLRDELLLALPPCDSERASYFQVGPHQLGDAEPLFEQRDCRALVGDGLPVAVGAEGARLEVGLAAVLSDDLWRASPREADRSVLGYTLLFDWWDRKQSWNKASSPARAPSQLGATLLTGVSAATLAKLELQLRVAGVERQQARLGSWRFDPGEVIAWLSQRVQLRAGDLVGLGAAAQLGGPGEPLSLGDQVVAQVPRWMRISGRASAAPPAGRWQR